MRGGLESSIDWIRELGVLVEGPLEKILGFGSGYRVDIGALIQRLATRVEKGKGIVVASAEAVDLITSQESVVGARVRDLQSSEDFMVKATSVVLATGGIHAGADMRHRFGVPGGQELVVRGNPWSDGAGIRMGIELGARCNDICDSYYGHPIPYPLDHIEERDLTALAMYHVEDSVLLDASGRRFCDESLGYSKAAEEIAKVGRAVLVTDERVRQEKILNPTTPAQDQDPSVDKMALAGERGANYAKAETLDEIADAVSSWGYDGGQLGRTLHEFNMHVEGEDEKLAYPRRANKQPLDKPPFEAIEVQSSITFAFAGLMTDDDGRVQSRNGDPIEGLFAAGMDAALNARASTGGLVRGLVLGRRVGREVAQRS